MSAPLHNRIALVTGASSGIGRGIARALAAAGAAVVLAARDRRRLDAVVAEIESNGGSAIAIPADVTDEADVVRLFATIAERYGRLDLLINNAGITINAPAHELTFAEWRRVLDVNLSGAFLCSREALRMMRTQRAGRIINIGSVAARVPRPNTAPYAAAKAGLAGLTHALAIEAREYGVTVCIVHPGNTRSGFWEARPDFADREGVMEPEQIARVIVTIATMPADVLIFETVMLPLAMPLLGRG
ncbi:MAG: SDR family oxidoreductase [Gammaproteobacteria bacterium]|nr:SDR family oxidoreductase [Gammaproteobacteria bacterium]